MGIIKAVLFIGFVSLVLFVVLGSPSISAKSQRVELDFQAIHRLIKAYASDAGQPPTTAQGLDALITEPRTSPKPKSWTQRMKMLPTDPWETPYRYKLLESKEGEWRWELRFAGSDRILENGDDWTSEGEWSDEAGLQDRNAEPPHSLSD